MKTRRLSSQLLLQELPQHPVPLKSRSSSRAKARRLRKAKLEASRAEAQNHTEELSRAGAKSRAEARSAETELTITQSFQISKMTFFGEHGPQMVTIRNDLDTTSTSSNSSNESQVSFPSLNNKPSEHGSIFDSLNMNRPSPITPVDEPTANSPQPPIMPTKVGRKHHCAFTFSAKDRERSNAKMLHRSMTVYHDLNKLQNR